SRPIPCDAPVTSATLSFKLNIHLSLATNRKTCHPERSEGSAFSFLTLRQPWPPQSSPASSPDSFRPQYSALPLTVQSPAPNPSARAAGRPPQACSRPHQSSPERTLPNAPASKPAESMHSALLRPFQSCPHPRL